MILNQKGRIPKRVRILKVYLNMSLGLAGIIYTAVYNHLSDKETKGWIQEVNKRLDDAGIPKSDSSTD